MSIRRCSGDNSYFDDICIAYIPVQLVQQPPVDVWEKGAGGRSLVTNDSFAVDPPRSRVRAEGLESALRRQ
jgi:hypothetical protein